MSWEDPDFLLRLKLGREEYCQRMLTSLILATTYPKWNTINAPSLLGNQFLNFLYQKSYNSKIDNKINFIDEFELQAMNDEEKGGAPDYAVFWNNNAWIIELKTEVSSHRKRQLPLYLDLMHHHYPGFNIDILYLTPKMHRHTTAGDAPHQFCHLFWTEILDILSSIWGNSEHPQERLLNTALQNEIINLNVPARSFRNKTNTIRTSLQIAIEVQENKKQAAVEINTSGLDELIDLRYRIQAAFKRHVKIKNVRPWIWHDSSSGGRALTKLGQETGCELRLSYYK